MMLKSIRYTAKIVCGVVLIFNLSQVNADPIEGGAVYEITVPTGYPVSFGTPDIAAPWPLSSGVQNLITGPSFFMGGFSSYADSNWAYASETGSVRAAATSSIYKFGYPTGTPATSNTLLFWQKTFTKGSDADTAHFTVNHGQLLLFAAPHQPGDAYFPSVHIAMSIIVIDEDTFLPVTNLPPTNYVYREFSADAIITHFENFHVFGPPNSTIVDNCNIVPPSINFPYLWNCASLHDAGTDSFASVSTQLPSPNDYHQFAPGIQPWNGVYIADNNTNNPYGLTDDALLQLDTYHGTLSSIKQIPVGHRYTVKYILTADVDSPQIRPEEVDAEAFIGDPLDVNSGITIETTSPVLPSDGSKAIRSCDIDVDPLHYTRNDNGTVTDNYSGLMWQRCPVGYVLDEMGTPTNMSDDRCNLVGTSDYTWQSALQTSVSDSSAGFNDWRVPNIKELDSITELHCNMPAIEPGAFPDTPQLAFWSSTPGADAMVAFVVKFIDGELTSLPKTTTTRVRLVRTSDTPTSTPVPGLRIGRPTAVTEGNSGNTDMIFPVALDRISDTDVSVNFTTVDYTATAGLDYVASNGTLLIPAGTRSGAIHIAILGDEISEANEELRVVLSSPSTNARLLVSHAEGEILDDDPKLRVVDASSDEGDVGLANLAFAVLLSKPASTDVSLDYTTNDGSAVAGQDYQATSGTLVIPAGQTAALIHVPVISNTTPGPDVSLTLTFSNVSSNARFPVDVASPSNIAHGYIVDDDHPTLQAFNDTGQTSCLNNQSRVTCPVVGAPGQDAEYGRDANSATNSNTDGDAGFVLTKRDSTGAPLTDQLANYNTTPWDCVSDEVTGLYWEVKTSGLTIALRGLRDVVWNYSWYNSSGDNDGGAAGTIGVDTTTNATRCGTGISRCDTESYIAAVNAMGLCGYHDWRLPTREELLSLVNGESSRYGDSNTFPSNHASSGAWTATPIDATHAWTGNTSGPSSNLKSSGANVQLVRGGQ
jgi:hypothetical protein